MSKPYTHAVSSAKKFGGAPDDFIEIHRFMDSSKVALPDPRHRAVFHSAFGVFAVEYVFGDTLTTSDGKKVSVRDVAEQHIIEDLGFIPTLEQWFSGMKIEPWMSLHIKDYETKEAKKTEPTGITIDADKFRVFPEKINPNDFWPRIYPNAPWVAPWPTDIIVRD